MAAKGRSEVGYRSAEVVDESCQEGAEEDVDVWYDFHDGEIDRKAYR